MLRVNTMGQIRLVAPWAVETVKKLVRAGAIQGHGDMDSDGFPSEMDLSLDMLRTFVVNDRMGVYDL